MVVQDAVWRAGHGCRHVRKGLRKVGPPRLHRPDPNARGNARGIWQDTPRRFRRGSIIQEPGGPKKFILRRERRHFQVARDFMRLPGRLRAGKPCKDDKAGTTTAMANCDGP